MNIRELIANRMPASRLADSYSGMSFSPGKRGADEFEANVEWLESRIPQLPEADRDDVLNRYLKLWGAYVAARGRCLSPMITGPARFPVDRNRKRLDIEHKRMGEFLDFQKSINGRIAAAKRGPDPNAPISGDDPDAIEKLKAKLAKVEAEWAQQKLWNAQYRKGGVDAMEGIGDKLKAQIAALMAREKWIKVPFNLSGFGPEVKRIKDRIIVLERRNDVPDVDRELAPGVLLMVRPDENRVRLEFDDKPSRDVIERLKRNGFKWAPSLGVWQRYYSENAVYAAMNAVKDI